MNKILLSVCLSVITLTAYSQPGMKDAYKFEFGFGLGYEYGGVGCHFSVAPIPYASAFIGLGINGGLGYNIGAAWHIIPKTTDKKIRPYVEAMYGYNFVVILLNETSGGVNITQYYGPSVGLGCEFRFGEKRRHGIDFCFPRYAFWSREAWDAYNDLEAEVRPVLGPWGYSIGYHFEF